MPNQSPYFTGAAPNFGPPSGMAGLISQDRSSQMDTSGFQKFADVAEKFKRQQDAGKAADYFVKASQQPDGSNPVLDSMGIHPEQWKTLGAGDKTSAIQGVVHAQAQKNVLQQFADVAAQAKERDAQAQSMGDTGDFLRSYAGALPNGTEDTPQNRLTNALKSLRPGADIGRVFPQAMNSLEKFATIGANSGGAQPVWQQDPKTGQRFLTYGKQVLPSGLDPNAAATGPTMSPDDQFFYDGKKWMNKKGTEITPKDALKTYNSNSIQLGKLYSTLDLAKDPKYSGLPGMDPAALQSQIDDLMQQQTSLKPLWQPTSAASKTPPSQARVTVQKDGKKFTLPQGQLQDALKQGYTQVQ